MEEQMNATSTQPRSEALTVTFESRGHSRRIWDATFDLGSDYENGLAACRVAHTHNAVIVCERWSPLPFALLHAEARRSA
jgi:hypothetical protein